MQSLVDKAIADGVFGDVSSALREDIAAFKPTIFYRNDPGLWEFLCFMADTRNSIISVHVDAADNAYLNLYVGDLKQRLSTRMNGDKEFPALKLFRDAVTAGHGAEIGKASVIALWVDRGFDAAKRIAQILYIAKRYGASFRAKIANRNHGNVFRHEDVMPFLEPPLAIEGPDQWRKNISLDTNLIECLAGDGEAENEINREMRQLVRSLAANEPAHVTENENACFKILVSLELEKRIFTNQDIFISTLLSRLSERHGNILLVVNGMTGFEDRIEDEFGDIKQVERQLVEQVCAKLSNVSVKFMHGKTFREKAGAYKQLDFFAAPIGTAALIPQILGIPGVVFGSAAMLKHYSWFNDITESRAVLSNPDWSQPVATDEAMRKYAWGWDDGSRLSYAIDVPSLVDLCLSQISAA